MSDTLTVTLDGQRKLKMEVPAKISSPEDFETMLSVRFTLTGISASYEPREFLDPMYYLLGWVLGDLGKHFDDKRRLMVSLEIGLSRRHPENLLLGEYVAEAIRDLGIHCSRGKDRAPSKFSPYSAYRWNAGSSGIFGWFHTICLGLRWDERASWVPVNMHWILTVRERKRLWFLRGLADSDGNVHFKDKSVDITTSPNTAFVVTLCESLGIHTRIRVSNGYGQVTMSASQAARVGIFNPDVQSYRKKLLDAVVNARTYQRHWPSWLQAKVTTLANSGLCKREICERLLLEDSTFVRMYTRSRKVRDRKLHIVSGGTIHKRNKAERLSRSTHNANELASSKERNMSRQKPWFEPIRLSMDQP